MNTVGIRFAIWLILCSPVFALAAVIAYFLITYIILDWRREIRASRKAKARKRRKKINKCKRPKSVQRGLYQQKPRRKAN